MLYLNVDGLTNLAIAEGPVCRFTRVVGGGIESMAAELAAKREVSTPEARGLLFAADLTEAARAEEWGPALADEPVRATAPADPPEGQTETDPAFVPHGVSPASSAPEGEAVPSAPEAPTVPQPDGSGYQEPATADHAAEEQVAYGDGYAGGLRRR